MSSQSSTRSAPPTAAASADSIPSTQTSTTIGDRCGTIGPHLLSGPRSASAGPLRTPPDDQREPRLGAGAELRGPRSLGGHAPAQGERLALELVDAPERLPPGGPILRGEVDRPRG